MRSLALLISFTTLISAEQLRVASASASSVHLEWSGAAGPVTVVRTAGPKSENLTMTDQAKYEDTSIARFGTYKYRVTVNGKSS
jgi:hypothetical protein